MSHLDIDLIHRVEVLERQLSDLHAERFRRTPQTELTSNLSQQISAKQAVAAEMLKAIDAYRCALLLAPHQLNSSFSIMAPAMQFDNLDSALLMLWCLNVEAEVIKLRKILRWTRRLYLVMWPFAYLLPITRAGAAVFKPKLGRLWHHPAIPMQTWGGAPTEALLASANLPCISIVTPSYRQGAYIQRTLESVLSQAYPHLEYYVQDGGSDDETTQVLSSYSDRLTGWTSEKDSGQSQAINLGFARTTGDIMAWLNSDDLLLPGALNCVAQYFAAHPDVDVVYGHRILIDEQDREIGRWILPAHNEKVLSVADFVPQETLFWRRSIWEKAGGKIDESFRFAMDWDLLLRFRSAGARMVRLPYFLGAFRIHQAQKTSAAIASVGAAEMDRLRERCHGRKLDYRQIRKAVVPYILWHMIEDFSMRFKRTLGVLR